MSKVEHKPFSPAYCVHKSYLTSIIEGNSNLILKNRLAIKVLLRREILTLKDGGEVALDWLEENCGDDAPCIIILPGLTGESQAEYIKCLVIAANNAGMRVVVFNNRGLGGIELKTPRLYCASNCEDLSEVVHHVRKNLAAHCKLGAAGISMGGLILGIQIIF